MLTQVYEPLLGLILPELCQRCGGAHGAGFCRACRREFIPNTAPCLICGCGPLSDGRQYCDFHPHDWRLAHVVAPLLYAPPLEGYVQRLKFARERALGRAMGQLLAEAAASRRSAVDALVSVPLHPERLLQRGFNQALEIARAVSAILHVPVLRSGIRRNRATLPQTRSRCAQRYANLESAFEVCRSLEGRRLAIVDDVMTTGATANALAAALYGAGAVHVEAWAVARTPPPKRGHSES